MSLQSITNISVDFCDKKYILINAKQYDSSSRWISVTCYDNGNLFNLSASKHVAYIRYRKADGNGVLNSCRINYKGEALVELTEQMLSADGICYVDLIIVNKGAAIVNIDTGEIITTDGSAIISTMAFCIKVYEAAVDNSLIESTHEYECSVLNELLTKANSDYKEVIQLAKSYAIGNANGIRENEDYDNSKYYSELAVESAHNADMSEANALSHMNNAKSHMTTARTYMDNAKSYMDSAKISETNAKTSEASIKTSEANIKTSETNAKASETNAKASETRAKTSETNAKASETNAKASEQNAKASEGNILSSANLSQSYAVGGTGTREGENTDNAKYYYGLLKNIVDSIGGAFVPMGTVTFAELKTVEKSAGFIYNISDNFVTDETFREGAGMPYTAGTNVYYTGDGYWDCFGGSVTPVASVDEVKTYLGL